MNLENQVTSFDTSKKLKKFGVEQKSIFAWKPFYFISNNEEINWNGKFKIKYNPATYTTGQEVFKPWYARYKELEAMTISAFTASELAEILTKLGHNRLPYFCNNPQELCWVYNFGDYPDYVSANTLVECLAEMIIYLKEKP